MKGRMKTKDAWALVTYLKSTKGMLGPFKVQGISLQEPMKRISCFNVNVEEIQPDFMDVELEGLALPEQLPGDDCEHEYAPNEDCPVCQDWIRKNR